MTPPAYTLLRVLRSIRISRAPGYLSFEGFNRSEGVLILGEAYLVIGQCLRLTPCHRAHMCIVRTTVQLLFKMYPRCIPVCSKIETSIIKYKGELCLSILSVRFGTCINISEFTGRYTPRAIRLNRQGVI